MEIHRDLFQAIADPTRYYHLNPGKKKEIEDFIEPFCGMAGLI